MAFLKHANVKCKNKLCDYRGSITFYDHEAICLVCPTCGFKTLERYYPELERIFNDSFGPKSPPKIPNDHPRG